MGIPPAEHDNALAQHRGLLHRTPPQSGHDVRMMPGDFDHAVSADPRKPSWHQRDEGMVYFFQQEYMQVEKVARHEKRQYLSTPVRHQPIAASQAPSDDKASAWRI